MSCPAGVADAEAAADRFSFDGLGEIGYAANGFADLDFPLVQNGNASRVVASVFEAAETIQKHR